MKHLYLFTIVVSSVLITACSDNKDDKETLIDPQIKAMEKAQNVEDVLKQKDTELRKRIDEQSR